MDFTGTGKRLAQGDIGEAARWLGTETAALLAFIEVEAAGRGFDAQNRPKMLFEPHVFYRELGKGTKAGILDRAIAAGLAYKSWGAKPYPKDSYPRLQQAYDLTPAPALRSASWGLGQILADKYSLCGHASEEAFVRANMQGEREQLLCMVALMIAWGIPKMLAGKDLKDPESWASAASKWNGSGFRKHNYHGRLAAAYVKHSKGEPMTPAAPVVAVLTQGMKGEAVRNLQNDLLAIGFPIVVDGRFGPGTEKVVRDFQTRVGITVDGKVGPATLEAIEVVLATFEQKTSPSPEWPGQDKPADPVFPAPIPATKANTPPMWLFVLVGVAVVAGLVFAFFSGGFNVR